MNLRFGFEDGIVRSAQQCETGSCLRARLGFDLDFLVMTMNAAFVSHLG